MVEVIRTTNEVRIIPPKPLGELKLTTSRNIMYSGDEYHYVKNFSINVVEDKDYENNFQLIKAFRNYKIKDANKYFFWYVELKGGEDYHYVTINKKYLKGE